MRCGRVKNRDRIATNAAVTANLRLGTRESNATLARSMLISGNAPATTQARQQPGFCANCGTVEAVNVIEVKGEGGYVGKIAGGVVGGLLGSQIGSGSGKTVAQIAGVVGGAVAGNEIEKRVNKTRHYDVVTRLQGGGIQTITYATEPSFKVGDKVRVENGLLVLNI